MVGPAVVHVFGLAQVELIGVRLLSKLDPLAKIAQIRMSGAYLWVAQMDDLVLEDVLDDGGLHLRVVHAHGGRLSIGCLLFVCCC